MRFIIPNSDKMRSLFQDVTSSGYSALGACRGPALSSQPLLRGRKVHRQSDEAAERRFICVPGRTAGLQDCRTPYLSVHAGQYVKGALK